MNREKIFGVLCKIEPTSGTDSVPVPGTDAVRVIGIPTLNYGFLESGMRDDAQTGRLIPADRTEPAGRYGTIDIPLEIKGAGAAYSASVLPEADAFWRMSGFARTLDVTGAAEFVRYTTLDLGMETATLYLYAANKLIKMVGCVAAPKLSGEALKRGIITFTVTGKIVSDPTEAALPALTLSAVKPPLFHTGATAIGAWTQSSGSPLVVRKADLDFGTQVSDRPSAGATDGLIGYLVTDRKTRQTLLVETVPLATFDPFAMAKTAGSGLPVSSYQFGTIQYNRMKVVTGRWALEAPGDGADRGLKTWNLQGNLVGDESITGRELYLKYD